MDILGVSGVFIQSDDPAALAAWYTKHLGFEFAEWEPGACFGFNFEFRLEDGRKSHTVFSIHRAKLPVTGAPRTVQLNLRVEDLPALVARLEAAGLSVEPLVDCEYGRFAWVTDPDGNRLELYQPGAEPGSF